MQVLPQLRSKDGRQERGVRMGDRTGLFFTYDDSDVFGIAFSIVYMPDDRTFQIALQVGWLALGIGYTFRKE